MPHESRPRVPLILALSAPLLLLHAGCGTPMPNVADSITFGTDDGGGGGGGGGQDGGGGPPAQQGAPTVTITAPANGSLVKISAITVTANVGRGSGAAITQVAAKVSGMAKAVAMSPLSNTSYQAQINLNGLMSGALTIQVTATNAAMLSTTATSSITWDAGPTIKINDPTAAAYSGSAPLELEVIGAQGLGTGGTGGAIKSVTATVQGVALTLSIDKIDPSYDWTASDIINFHDPMFAAALSGDQVVHVEATNNNGATTVIEKGFVVDESGPDIQPVAPLPGTLIGSVTTLSAKITDPSGVDDTTAVAVIAGDIVDFLVPLTRSPGMDTFTGRFDTHRLSTSFVMPVISFRAQDRLGNKTDTGPYGYEVFVDNMTPVMSLQPPNMQLFRIGKSGTAECSFSFQPLGGDAFLAQDGLVLPQVITVRARVADRGNTAPGLEVPHLADIDPTSVELLAVPMTVGGASPSPPLVVDADGKGSCNNLNPNLVPVSTITASNQALVLAMVALQGGGTPGFGQDLTDPYSDPQYQGACQAPDTVDVTPPNPICNDGGPLYIREGQIWTLPPIKGQDCLGLQFDTKNIVPNGGAFCLAVRAADNVGNRNISAPIRVCVDPPGTPAGKHSATCAAFLSTLHSSLASCKGKFDPVTQNVTTGAAGECSPNPAKPFPTQGEPYKF